jgi:hypothetical protein
MHKSLRRKISRLVPFYYWEMTVVMVVLVAHQHMIAN